MVGAAAERWSWWSQLTGFVSAVAVVSGVVYLFIIVWATTGSASTPGPIRTLFVLVAAVLAVLLGRPSGAWRRGAIIGVGLILIAVVGVEFVGQNPSLGVGQLGALVGAAVALPLLSSVFSGRHRYLVPGLLTLAFVLVAVALVRVVLDGGALGHDESAYALKARSWLSGTPDTGWQLHRAPFITVLGLPVIAFTESEVAIRVVGVLTALFALGVVAMIGARFGGKWVGLLSVAAVGASLPYLRRGSEYLTDVPAAGLLLLIVGVVVRAAREPSNAARSVVWLGPLVAAAFYMRYQSALAVVAIAIGAFVVWPSEMKQLRRPLTLAAAIAVGLIVPHLVWATIVTGAPWGVILETSDAAGRAYLGEGLVDYGRDFFVDLTGPLGAALVLLAAGWIVWVLLSKSVREGDRSLALFVAIVALVIVVPLGLVAHGEPRFVFFPVWLLIALGSVATVRVVGTMSLRWVPALVAAATLLWLPLLTESVRVVDQNAEGRAESLSVLVDASNQIETDASGTCNVLTTYQPQVTWYSVCFTEFMERGWDPTRFADLPGDRDFVLLFENGKRQPSDAEERYGDVGVNTQVSAATPVPGDATIIALP